MKAIDEMKSHPKRKEKLDMDYDYYVKMCAENR